MPWHSLLIALMLGLMVLSGSAAALTIATSDPNAVLGPRDEPEACARAGCLQPVQMQMGPFVDRLLAGGMPADQRELLSRLLSPELSEVVSPAERQILSQALERGDRLSAEAVSELNAMLREKRSQQTQRLATAKAEAERQRQQEQAAAEAERQRQSEQAAAEAERRRETEQAEAERQRQRQAQTAAATERRRQTEQAAAEAERQRQGKVAAADAERQRQAAATAEAERRRQAQLAVAEAERQRQSAEAAQALAEAKREAETAAANAGRLVFYDEFPPLQPL